MQRLLLLSLFLLFSWNLSAQDSGLDIQHSYYSYVYKITNKQAVKAYKANSIKNDTLLFQHLVDSFPVGSWQLDNLPQGHYVIASVSGNRLNLTLHTENKFEPLVVNNSNDFSMVIMSDKALIEDAVVRVDGCRVRFDKKSHTYRIAKGHPSGFLTIEKEGHLAIFKIKKDIKTNRVLTFLNRKPVRYVWTPVRLVVGSPFDLYASVRYLRPAGLFYWLWKPFGDVGRSIRWEEPQGWVATVADFTESISYGEPEESMEKLWEFFNHSFRAKVGFILFNQPKYRPNDTVRFKIFVADYKGRLKDEALDLKLNDKVLRKLKPYRTGFYESFIVLHDSLNLKVDRSYSISVENEKGRDVIGYFQLEDYELKNSAFEASLAMGNHNRGQINEVVCNVSDANGNPISDAKVEITVLPKQANSRLAKAVFLPDTLWHHIQKLDDAAKTPIALPDSIFPELSLNYLVNLTLTGENNEIKHFSLNAMFDGVADRIVVEHAGQDSAVARYYHNSKEIKQRGALSVGSKDTVGVEYPYYFVPEAMVESYQFTSPDTYTTFNPSEEWSRVGISATRTVDSVLIRISNPRKLPVSYFLYKGNGELRRGVCISDSSIAVRFKGKRSCSLFASYPWAGKVVEKSYSVDNVAVPLNVSLVAPANAVPGQQVEVKVAVTDSKGEPVSNADVSVWAYTSRFGGYSMPNFPNFHPIGSRGRIERNRFYIYGNDDEVEANHRLKYRFWRHRMNLDSLEFYRFLFPDTGLYIQSYATPDSITSISPYIHRNGVPLNVQQINLNGWPVFFGLENCDKPYLFPALLSNNLEFYYKDSVFYFNDIKIPEKRQSIVSIDLGNPNCRFVAVPKSKKMLDVQVADANRYIAQFEQQHTPFYLQQFDSYKLGKSAGWANPIRIGAFFSSDFTMVRQGQSFKLKFEPGYVYSFGDNYVKMKSVPAFTASQVQSSGRQIPWVFKHRLVTRDVAESYIAPKRDLYSALFRGAYENYEGKTSVIFEYDWRQKSPMPEAIVVISSDGNRLIRCDRTSNVLQNPSYIAKAGYYKVIMFYPDKVHFVDSIKIPLGGKFFIKIDNSTIAGKQMRLIDLARFGTFPLEPLSLQSKAAISTPSIPVVAPDSDKKESAQMQRVSGVSGVVISSDDGMPLPGVSVMVVGTTQGTATNLDGQFSFTTWGGSVLRFMFIGYKQVDLPITPGVLMNVTLEPEVMRIDEVVVTAFGISRKSFVTGSAVVMESALQGKVAGVQVSGVPGASQNVYIRGASSISAGSEPLYIVDGVPMTAEQFALLDKNSVGTMNVLKGAQAIGLYGSRAANGVVVIVTKGGRVPLDISKVMQDSSYMAALEGASAMRTKFKDYAFWQPRLTTDKNGIASFKAKLPDDITTWTTNAVVVSPKLNIANAEASIKAFKPAMAVLSLPRFMVEGDSVWVRGRVTSYMDQKQHVSRSFKIADKSVAFADSLMGKLLVDSTLVVAPSADSLSIEYTASVANSISDRERRTIPINITGTKESLGLFALAENDTTIVFPDSLQAKRVTIFASSGSLDLLQKLTESVTSYGYLCNEQASSKLIAHLMLKKAVEMSGKTFDGDKQIKALIKRLVESRSTGGLWGWWKDAPEVGWISQQVVKSLAMAKEQGYEVNFDFSSAIRSLKEQLTVSKSYMGIADLIATIHLMEKSSDLTIWAKRALALKKNSKDSSLFSAIILTEMQMNLGLLKTVPDSLLKLAKPSFGNGSYWGSFSYWPDQNKLVLTAKMYKMVKLDSLHRDWLPRIRRYFLYELNTNEYINTYSKMVMIEAIYADLFVEGKTGTPTVTIHNGKESIAVNEFPFTKVIEPNGKVSITKRDGRPVFLTAYMQRHNRIPVAVDDYFTVKSFFSDKNGVNNRDGNVLTAGSVASLWVKVSVKKLSPYAMVEIPIPAGCSYDDKQPWGRGECYREKFKDHVAVFFYSLSPGEYEIEVKLVPRFTGRFTLNPARAELMYFPIFFGREGLKKITVK